MHAQPLSLASLAFLFAACSIATTPAQAQITNVTNDQATPIPGAGHDYIKMLSETVNPSNGSVSLRIKAPMPHGRGLNLPFGFDHDTSGVHHLATNPNGNPVWGVDLTPYTRGGWSYLIPLTTYVLGTYVVGDNDGTGSSSCDYYTGFVFQDPEGTRHALGIASAQPTTPGGTCTIPAVTVQNAGDDYYRASIPNAWPSTPNATVASADGTVYNFGCNPCNPSSNGDALAVVRIEDRNGNIATSTSNSQNAYTLVDTLGRTLISTSGFASSSGDTIYLSGLTNPYVVTWKTEASNFTIPIDYLDGTCSVPANTDQRTVVSSIELPNGQAYTFLYGTDDRSNSNPYGLLSKIVYPSGGWVKYSYGINTNSDAFDTTITTYTLNGGIVQTPCIFSYGTPAVTQRTVSFNGSTVALQQTFTYSTTWNGIEWSQKTSTVTTDDLISGQSSITNYVYSPVNIPNPPNMPSGAGNLVPVEETITYENGSGPALETVNKTWYDQYLLKSETVTPAGISQGSEVTYAYGSGGQLTSKSEYDYTGSLIRTTNITYQAFPNTPIFQEGPSIFDRPCQIVVNSSGGRVAETDYLYDGGTALCGTSGTSSTASAPTPSGTHDEANYGPQSTNPRGNATTKTVQCLQSCTNAVTTYTYDETGQELSMTDPCGNSTCADVVGTTHTTAYSYSDSYAPCSGAAPPAGNTNAYLTKITDPLGHTQSFCYGYTDGQVRGATDQNGQTTSYTYNDPLGRLTQVQDADKGQTTYTYVDTPPAPTVTKNKELQTSGFGTYIVNVSTMDGMGHITQTQLTSDPDGTDTTAITYDGHGHVYTKSNPYRTTGDSTYGVTTYTYDALDRVTQVADPGFNSTIVTSYGVCTASSNATGITVTDEAGISRESCADGLGRTTYVVENPSGLAYQTTYTYDVLDDLTGLVQNGSRQRSFVYNSLKQLTSSTNPESNTAPANQTTVPTTIQYDANGNLSSKAMPAQNQQGTSTVTISYCYDVLNRMTGKAYTQQSCPMSSPVATYSFDSSACLGQSSCFNIGRRTAMADPAGTESWAYDNMGRVLTDQRTTNGLTNSTTYVYSPYVDGSINTVTYPSGRVMTYTTGAAERALSVVDSAINYATAAHYVASGALAAVQNGGILNSTYIYNNRLQPCWSYTTTSTALATSTSCGATDSTPGNILDLSYKYAWPGFEGNNGDVIGITNNRDTTRSQSFTYDALNRILTAETASTYATSPAHCWGEAYIYDNQPSGTGAWGNLTDINAASSSYSGCTQESLSVSVNAQNQIEGDTYDSAGNMLSPALSGSTFTYNAENQLTQATTDVGTTSYVYDGDGKRVEKVVAGGVTKIYWYDPSGNVLDETDGSGSMTNTNFYEYIFFRGIRIGRRDSSGNVLYYFADHLGTSRSIAEVLSGQDTATLCYDADFYPFAGERAYTNNCAQNYKFTGKERDSESNLDFFDARYYSSSMGRFMTPDWSTSPDAVPYADLSDPQTLNLYSYVRNNPLSRVDPNGHCFWECLKNLFRWEVWTTDDKVESALQSKADQQRQWLAKEQVSYGGKLLTSDYLKSLSNKQVYDLAIGYGSAVATGDVGVEVHHDGQVYTADVHHLLPRANEFRNYFDDAPLNIEDYTMDLPRDVHIDIHSGKGMGSGGAWNNAWREFFRQNPNANAEQILEQANRMADEFGLRQYDIKNMLKDGEEPIE